ncbi:MAG TPA: STAS domain-containing protein [Rectinemataceae bacterium]|nr:STAS domain-containing protein [Rectinemataceae bacterium]
MPSRLLARARLSAPADSSLRETDSVFDIPAEIPEGLCCHPRGSLDGGRVEALNDDIVAALDANTKTLLLDFSRIEDIESAGVGFLVALQKRMRGRGGDLILYGLRPKQQRFLEILGFKDFFSTALDLRCALEYILGIKRDVFPISAICPACSSPLGVDGPGRSRCHFCRAVLTVMPDGGIELG